MAYSNPIYQTVSRTVAGGTGASWTVSPPKGCNQCRVVGINASVTTNFVGTTAAATFTVGVPSNLAVAGSLAFGTTAAPAQAGVALGLNFKQGINPLIATIDLTGTANPSAITVAQPAIVALGPVTLTFNAAVGTPAGAAVVDVTLAWF